MLSFVFNKHTYNIHLLCHQLVTSQFVLNQQFIANNSTNKEIVYYRKQSIGLFFHALPK